MNETSVDVCVVGAGPVGATLACRLAEHGFTVAALDRPEHRFVGTGRRLTEIGVLFLVSLTARTLDRSVCAALPIGTHALWHVLNAVVLYALVVTAIRHRAAVP